jgi:hypothetical protein
MFISISISILFGAILSWGAYFGGSHLIAGDIGEGIAWLLVPCYVMMREFGIGGLFRRGD